MTAYHGTADIPRLNFVLVGAAVPPQAFGGPLNDPRGQIPHVEDLQRAVQMARRRGYDFYVYVVDPNLDTPESRRYMAEFSPLDHIQFIPAMDHETELDIPGGYVFKLTYTGHPGGDLASYGRGTLVQTLDFGCEVEVPNLSHFVTQIFDALDHGLPAQIATDGTFRSSGNGICFPRRRVIRPPPTVEPVRRPLITLPVPLEGTLPGTSGAFEGTLRSFGGDVTRRRHRSLDVVNVLLLHVPSHGQTYNSDDIDQAGEYLKSRGFDLQVVFVRATQTRFDHPAVTWIETEPGELDLTLRGETILLNFDSRFATPNTLRRFRGHISFASFFKPQFRFNFRTFFGVKLNDSTYNVTDSRHWTGHSVLPKESVEWLIDATHLLLDVNELAPEAIIERLYQESAGILIYFRLEGGIGIENLNRLVRHALRAHKISFDSLTHELVNEVFWHQLYFVPRGL